ncbi:MAG: hypothetical protein HY719_17725 [Planctomycetes bacterium]|nr:hypothetical protein [Planctomycetota bacterium]
MTRRPRRAAIGAGGRLGRAATAAFLTLLLLAPAGCWSFTPNYSTLGFPVSQQEYEANTWDDFDIWVWTWSREPREWSGTACLGNTFFSLLLTPLSFVWLSAMGTFGDGDGEGGDVGGDGE